MRAKVLAFVCGLLLLQALQTSSVASDDDELPSIEMLEFLGSFQTDDGEWVDPEELDVIDIAGEETDETKNEL